MISTFFIQITIKVIYRADKEYNLLRMLNVGKDNEIKYTQE